MNQQESLFESEHEQLPIVDGSLDYYPQWLSTAEASQLFSQLKQEVNWQQSTINLYGKQVKIPRLNAWYGDEHCPYAYSGHHFQPLPWLPVLFYLKQRVEARTGFGFNSVLVNCYRDGGDSVAWHSDDEPELGKNPVVASLSLGAERYFHLRHRYKKQVPLKKVLLGHGSLLVMSGEIQHYWHHQLPKTSKPIGERINLTFRYVRADL